MFEINENKQNWCFSFKCIQTLISYIVKNSTPQIIQLLSYGKWCTGTLWHSFILERIFDPFYIYLWEFHINDLTNCYFYKESNSKKSPKPPEIIMLIDLEQCVKKSISKMGLTRPHTDYNKKSPNFIRTEDRHQIT